MDKWSGVSELHPVRGMMSFFFLDDVIPGIAKYYVSAAPDDAYICVLSLVLVILGLLSLAFFLFAVV